MSGPIDNFGKVDTVPHYHLNTTKHLCHTSLLNRGLPISNSQIIPNLVPNSVFPYTQICHVTRSDFGFETGQQMVNQESLCEIYVSKPNLVLYLTLSSAFWADLQRGLAVWTCTAAALLLQLKNLETKALQLTPANWRRHHILLFHAADNRKIHLFRCVRISSTCLRILSFSEKMGP